MQTDMQARRDAIDPLLGALSLPRRAHSALSFCSTNATALREHLQQLPPARPVALSQQLYKHIPEVAGLEAEPGRKLAMLDLLRPLAIANADKLTARLTLNEHNTRTVSLSIGILRSLAEGYKAVAVAAVHQEEVTPGLLASALHGALTAMNRLLLICWQCYITPPGNFWQELHALYQIGRYFKVDSVPVGPAANTMTSQRQTVRTAYLKPLLLACANPGHYTPTELRTIFDFLDHCAHLGEFAKGHERGLFVVDTKSNHGPVYASRMPQTTSQHLSLRTHNLVSLMQDVEQQNPQTTLPARIRDDLCRYWSEERVRRDQHLGDETPVEVVLGLPRIHRLLSGARRMDDFLQRMTDIRGIDDYRLSGNKLPSSTRDMLSSEDPWSWAHDVDETSHEVRHDRPLDTPLEYQPSTTDSRRSRPESKPRDQEPPPEHDPITVHSGIRINTSSKGACVEMSDAPDNLTPGELIAVREKEGDSWLIGIIRWVQTTPRLDRLTGMEFLDRAPTPCAACLAKMNRPASPYLGGLLFDNGGSERELVVPSMPFKPHNRVIILSADNAEITQLRTALDSTSHMSRFQLANP